MNDHSPLSAAEAEDRALVDRVAGKDQQAFRCLYERHYDRVFRFLFSLTRRYEIAEESANDVFLVLWESAASFKGESAVSTWLMGIAYRKGLKQLEQLRRFRKSEPFPHSPAANEPFQASNEPTKELELEDWILAGLRELPFEQRTVVELTYFWGHAYEEIALILDCPVNTVKTRMFHARRKLRSILPSLEATPKPPQSIKS